LRILRAFEEVKKGWGYLNQNCSVPQLIQTIFPCREWRGVVEFLANSGIDFTHLCCTNFHCGEKAKAFSGGIVSQKASSDYPSME